MDQKIRLKNMLDSMRQITHGEAPPFKDDLDAFLSAYKYGVKKHVAADVSEILTVDDPDGIIAVLAEHLRQRSSESLDDLDVLCLAGSVLVSLGFQGLGNRLEGVLCSHLVGMFEQGKKRLSTGRKSKLSKEDKERACAAVRIRRDNNKNLSLKNACELESVNWGVSGRSLENLMKGKKERN
ncbi:hypothetical protein ACK335_04290 [Aeromonas veronii]